MLKPSQTFGFQVFDRDLRRQRRARFFAQHLSHNALFDEMACQLSERVQDVKKDFAFILDIGGQGSIATQNQKSFVVSTSMSNRATAEATKKVVADEELLPFAAQSFDLIVSNAVLHWVNDLPGTLMQIRHILKQEGLFLAAMLGGRTLQELRHCLLDAELVVTGGISPRLSPTISLQDASGLLQRAGFQLPVADSETITMTYPDAFALMRDLRGMGEGNAHLQRLRHPTRRAVFEKTAQLYGERYPIKDGGIFATFEVIFLHGWS